ncbi:MAG: hypothetical protein WCV71_02180 [Patescibacteria group bacterium]
MSQLIFPKIKILLEKSKLDKNKIDKLLVQLSRIPDNSLAGLLEILEEDVSQAEIIFENYQKKKQLATNFDHDKWGALLEEEKVTLEKNNL